MELLNSVGIITGATSGIGWATAERLSAAGAKLVLTGRRQERLDELLGKLGTEAVAMAGDIADLAFPKQLVDTALARFGQLDFVFNNAGIMNIGNIDEVTDEAMTTMIRVNYEAAVRLAYAALRVFKPQGRGDLITTSSILGLKVRAGVAVYAGTKYAVEALSESLRLELAGTGVRVMVVEPGYTATDLQSHWKPQQKLMLKAVTKPVQPDDIARAVQFMLEQPSHVVIPRLLMLPAEQTL
ncbi:MAG: SDR family oxidoreductase [Thermoguttaceae bacterium]|jgi:NADP-dependent 3-hydroxy acid dehydrogenase YdfG|nr:SDR family oxidoreductase [Thermoguttaceae bacterium]